MVQIAKLTSCHLLLLFAVVLMSTLSGCGNGDPYQPVLFTPTDTETLQNDFDAPTSTELTEAEENEEFVWKDPNNTCQKMAGGTQASPKGTLFSNGDGTYTDRGDDCNDALGLVNENQLAFSLDRRLVGLGSGIYARSAGPLDSASFVAVWCSLSDRDIIVYGEGSALKAQVVLKTGDTSIEEDETSVSVTVAPSFYEFRGLPIILRVLRQNTDSYTDAAQVIYIWNGQVEQLNNISCRVHIP